MEEIWKDVVGYEGYYKVSNLGRVLSLDRVVIFKNGRKKIYIGEFKKSPCNSSGYPTVGLCKNGIPVSKPVHRLLMTAFYGESILHIDHINGVKTDNRIENLEYVTQRENTTRGWAKKETSSSYTGVVWDKRNKNFMAQIILNGKYKYLGRFASEIDASNAYKQALSTIK